MDKKELRRFIRERKRRMTQEEIDSRSRLLTEMLLSTRLYREAKTVYGYLSYNQEVRTLPFLTRCLRDGKQVAVPKVVGNEMVFIRMDDLSRTVPGYAGIPEPMEDGPVAADPSALVLMPGLAFDPMGHRIGYGGGFYDRFLEKEPNHPTAALCYDFQMLPYLATQAFDIPVDLVLWA